MSLAGLGVIASTQNCAAVRNDGWRDRAEAWHSGSIALVLAGALTLWFAGAIHGGPTAGGALLLVGGALSGVPHGSSDFVVAHRVLAPRWGVAWLPLFGVAYLAVVGLVMASWLCVPLATLLAFLMISGLHFGAGDVRPGENALPGWRWMARATTPLVPMILFHAKALAPFMAALGGTDQGTILNGIGAVGPFLLVAWGFSVAAILLHDARRVAHEGAGWAGWLTIVELSGLALAAVVLPPLLTFAIYFCVVHAVRHMLDLAHDRHPQQAARARSLVLRVLLPSSLVCLLALAMTWDRLGGGMGTPALIVAAIRLVAALTVPHMMLERLAEHHRGVRGLSPDAARASAGDPRSPRR